MQSITSHLTRDNASKALNMGCDYLRANPMAAEFAPKGVMAGCSLFDHYKRPAPRTVEVRMRPRKRLVKRKKRR